MLLWHGEAAHRAAHPRIDSVLGCEMLLDFPEWCRHVFSSLAPLLVQCTHAQLRELAAMNGTLKDTEYCTNCAEPGREGDGKLATRMCKCFQLMEAAGDPDLHAHVVPRAHVLGVGSLQRLEGVSHAAMAARTHDGSLRETILTP